MPQQLTDTNGRCLNCGAALQGNFCVQCGQRASTKRINFKETLNSFLGLTFSLDGPLLLTIKLLFVNPGKLFREYIAGKRKTYYKPVAFFVLITAVHLILRALINFDPLEGEFVNNGQENLSGLEAKIEEAARLVSENINNFMFFLVFSIAFMLKLFFRKAYNLAEYTSIGLFMVSAYILFKIITMFIAKFAMIDIDNIGLAILILLIFYSSFSLFRNFNFWSVVKYSLVSLLSLVLFIIFGVGFFFLIMLLQ